MRPFEAEISRGMEWLDTNYPDWEWRINLAELKLRSCHLCVMGQVTGRYDTALLTPVTLLTPVRATEVSHSLGFSVRIEHLHEYLQQWDILQAEWERQIISRRMHCNARLEKSLTIMEKVHG
jgi:hypothetical protein